MAAKHIHTLDICFNVESDQADPYKLLKGELYKALKDRIDSLVDGEWVVGEAIGYCDSYRNEARFRLGDSRK